MNKARKMVILLAALCVFGFILTIFDFLALHDIQNEYVSTGILKRLNITLSGELPEWTSTKGEWDIVRISYLFRFVFFILCAGVMLKLLNRWQTTES